MVRHCKDNSWAGANHSWHGQQPWFRCLVRHLFKRSWRHLSFFISGSTRHLAQRWHGGQPFERWWPKHHQVWAQLGAWQLTTAPNQDSYSPHLKSAQGQLDQFLLVGVMDDSPLKLEPIDMQFALVTGDQVIGSERVKQAIPAVLSRLTNRKATSATRLPRSP